MTTSDPRRHALFTFDEVANQVRRALGGRVPAAGLHEDTRLTDVGLSSLQISEILFRLEEEHEMEFNTARAAGVQTLGDIVMLGAEPV
jgi:acyl carrier protein